LGPSFMKIWTCGSSPRSGSRNAWTRIKNVKGAVVWATFAIFSARSKWFPVRRDWWPWTKPGYITMTRRLKLSFIIYSIKRNRMSFLNTHRLFWLSTILLTNIQIQIQTYTHTHTHGEHTYIHACMQIQGSQLHSNDNIIKQDNLTEDYHITILFV